MDRFPPKRLLAAVDLTEPSRSALEAAKDLAAAWDASVELVYVRPPAPVSVWVGGDGVTAAVDVAPEAPGDVERRLRAAAAELPLERVRTRLLRGYPPTALASLARASRAGMLVVGSHGYSGLERLETGSVSEEVIRLSRVPVLAVPSGTDVAGVARVLAPWNARPYATRALRWARELARDLRATLEVLHVVEPGDAPGRAAREKRLAVLLGPASDWCYRELKGDARALIAAEAESGRCGLAVLSAHRRARAGDAVLGSTLERVLRRRALPVLAVPSTQGHPRSFRRAAARAGARLY